MKISRAPYRKKRSRSKSRRGVVKSTTPSKNELLKTPPGTLVGARAIIEYLIEWDKECDPETSYEYLSTLLRSPIFAQEEART
jgi:hypothetical protein